MAIKSISTDKAPKAVGPYSQASCGGPWIFCSGQIPIDPATNELLKGSIQEQTHQVMRNIGHVLKAAGADFADVVKVSIFLQNLDHFSAVNEVYAEYFTPPYPARATVEVAKLPLGADIEIEAIALREN